MLPFQLDNLDPYQVFRRQMIMNRIMNCAGPKGLNPKAIGKELMTKYPV